MKLTLNDIIDSAAKAMGANLSNMKGSEIMKVKSDVLAAYQNCKGLPAVKHLEAYDKACEMLIVKH